MGHTSSHLFSSVGHTLPLLWLAGNYQIFEIRVMCHASGKPCCPPCPHPGVSCLCPGTALGTPCDKDWLAGRPPHQAVSNWAAPQGLSLCQSQSASVELDEEEELVNSESWGTEVHFAPNGDLQGLEGSLLV